MSGLRQQRHRVQLTQEVIPSTQIELRLVVATNHNLESMIATREFRSDLYYRLNVFPFAFGLYVSARTIFSCCSLLGAKVCTADGEADRNDPYSDNESTNGMELAQKRQGNGKLRRLRCEAS